MQGGGVQAVQLVLLLLLVFVVVFGALARRLQTPFPIVLLIAGLALSFIPGIPRVTLDPDFVFFVFLPPLLYAGAWTTSWRDFSYNLVSICSLAFGLVAFTVLGVAFCARWAFGGFDWRLGVVLGAVVAPTDAIAATTIAKRLGLPRRIVDVLEGESLVNDATGLLALEFRIALVVYVLIGLQLPYVLAGIRGQYGLRALLLYGALFSAVVVLLRLFWVFPGARLAYFVRRRILGQRENTPPARQIFVVGWTGMRGVIALAAALALPQMLSDGRPFPQRNLIIFLTFCVIVVTLVGQGLSLPVVIRALE